MNLNKVSLIGVLIKDPVKKVTSTKTEISLFTIATNYIWKDPKTKEKKESVEFHPIVAWGKLARVVNNYLEKSSKVYLEGRLHTRSWQDKSKQLHYRTEVIASNVIFLGDKPTKHKARKDIDDIEVEEVPVIDYED